MLLLKVAGQSLTFSTWFLIFSNLLRANSIPDHTDHTSQKGVDSAHLSEQEDSNNHAQQPVENGSPELTAENLVRHTRETESQGPSSANETALPKWDYIKMKNSKKSSNVTKETQTESTPISKTSTKSIPNTDARFPKLVQKNGVLDKEDSLESSNIAEIRNTLKKSRESPSPTLEQFKDFTWEVQVSETGHDIERVTIPLLKKYQDRNHKRVDNQQFTEFPHNIGLNDGLSAPKPDFVEGYLERAFEPYPVKDRLGGSAVPTPNKYPIALAHIVGEFKKRGGDFECGTQQTAYDAACLVYGRNNADIFMGKLTQANRAHVGSFVTDGDRVALSVHYAAKDSSGKTVYHQLPVFDSGIRTDYESFKTGYRHLRNIQDWARNNAQSTKDGLIAHYHQRSEGAEKDKESPTLESTENQ